MLYEDSGTLKFSDKKVIFTKNGVEEESFVASEGLEWWENLENKGKIEIVEVLEITHTEEETNRLEEIKKLKVDLELIEDYIVNGDYTVLKGDSQELDNFILRKKNEVLQETVDMLLIDSLGGM